MTPAHQQTSTADSVTRGVTGCFNGTSLYYEDTGSGEPIVFSHGLLWNRLMFAEKVRTLSNEFRCISYDHRGQGLSSDDPRDEIDVATLCDDAIALIEDLQIGPVHFCGHSLGGFVGILLAAKRPDLLRSLVLCNTAANVDSIGAHLKYTLLNFLARMFGPASVADVLMPMMFGRSYLECAENRTKCSEWRRLIASNRPTIWRAANGVVKRKCQRELARTIRVPTLILTGNEDRLRSLDEAKLLLCSIPEAMLVCVPNAGHMLPLEQPEAAGEAIRTFIASLRSE